MTRILQNIVEWWDGYAILLLIVVAVLLAMAGCNQQRQRPWQHEPTPDHWLESYWMSETEYRAKREWERKHPPENLYDAMTR